MLNEASSFHGVSQSVAKHAASARVSVWFRDWTRRVNCHMGDSSVVSLFFFKRRTIGQFSLVVHGRFLGDERHVSGRGSVNGSAQNSVVGVRGSREGFPRTASKGVTAFLATPNADGLSLDLLVLTNGARVLARTLGPLPNLRFGAQKHRIVLQTVRLHRLFGFALPISSPPCLLRVSEVQRIAFGPHRRSRQTRRE